MMSDARSLERTRDKIHIRLARESDMSAMIPVVNAAFVVEGFLEGTRTDQARMSKMMQTGEFLIAEDAERKVVASVYTECSGQNAYLGMLAVDPSQQGTGLGKRIAEAAESHCRERGCRQMKITVLSLRSELVAFYHKLGYQEAGTEPFRPSRALKPGLECHAIIMTKQL